MKNPELIGASPRVHARVTGLVGLLVLISGSLAGLVGSRLVVRGDVIATSNNIVASELLHRLGKLSSLVMMIAHLSELALLLWLLIKGVDADRWQRRILESTTQ
jgi:hypothetical protein